MKIESPIGRSPAPAPWCLSAPNGLVGVVGEGEPLWPSRLNIMAQALFLVSSPRLPQPPNTSGVHVATTNPAPRSRGPGGGGGARLGLRIHFWICLPTPEPLRIGETDTSHVAWKRSIQHCYPTHKCSARRFQKNSKGGVYSRVCGTEIGRRSFRLGTAVGVPVVPDGGGSYGVEKAA